MTIEAENEATTPGCKWVCHECGFVTDSTAEALEHPWEGTDGYVPGENFGHWLYEHPDGDRGKPPQREIHTSDHGGCYLSPVEESQANWVARKFREGLAAGGF